MYRQAGAANRRRLCNDPDRSLLIVVGASFSNHTGIRPANLKGAHFWRSPVTADSGL
jgi:hypothetical protein